MSNRRISRANDSIREQISGSGWRPWILMRMNRNVLSGAILVGIFVALVLLSFATLSPFRVLVEEADALQNLFSSMIGPIITGVMFVVTIGQLVLSQELGALGDQRKRMNEALDFRRDVEQRGGFTTSPPEPAAFLGEIIGAIENSGDHLRDATEGEQDTALRSRIEEFTETLDEHAEIVRKAIEDAQFGTFDLIWTALAFNYSWMIFEAHHIQGEYAESLSDDTAHAFDDLIETLAFFGPAREHFKTLYFQWELINLSRALLYAAIPALVVVAGMLMYVDPAAVTGVTFGVDNLVWLTSAAFTIGLIPFILLLSYILRITTVAQRTLAMGPFILRETMRSPEREG